MRYFIQVIFLLLAFLVFAPPAGALGSVPILMYHYIGDNPNPKDVARYSLSVSPEKFDAQMDYLSKNGYTPITLDTLYGIFNRQTDAPPKPIVLTFDDGYIDFYTTAFPILKKHNFHAVSFVITGSVGKSYYMNWDQIREIQSTGLVTFEGHASTHKSLTYLNSNQLIKELSESKRVLESQTGYPVNFINYPNGASNEFVRNVALKTGYVGGVGTWYGRASGPSLNLPRIRITGQMTLKDFISRL